MRRCVKGCAGSGRCLSGCRDLKKQSLNLNYIPEVLARGGVVLSSAPVDRVTVTHGRATGVIGRFQHPTTRRPGARFQVTARKAVIVAASVTGTPTLLRRSGVRNPMLGRGFRAHPGLGLLGLYEDRVDMDFGATQGWASMALRDAPGLKFETLALPLDLVAGRLGGGGRELVERIADYPHFAHWVIALRAESVGRIQWVFGKPVIRYSLSPVDMAKLQAGVRVLAEAHFAAGAKRVVTGVVGLPYSIGPGDLGLLDGLPDDPSHYVAILSHLFGGAVMGRDPRTSVVDERGRVHGLGNLVVADAAQIPTNLGVNPQHTIMGLGRLRAEQLLAA
jgi:choline dehydrogenase-like flavoprotein